MDASRHHRGAALDGHARGRLLLGEAENLRWLSLHSKTLNRHVLLAALSLEYLFVSIVF